MAFSRLVWIGGIGLVSSFELCAQAVAPMNPGRHRVEILSSADGSMQPSYITVPEPRPAPERAPLVVVLHTWSFDVDQRQPELEAEAAARGWLLLAPNFRGRNDHPEACGSPLAQQDILDAVAWVRSRYPVDDRRIYVLGLSGGGFMTMLMAARRPDLWAAASAWVGISDLGDWYSAHREGDFGRMIRSCFGGTPDGNRAIANEMAARSPLRYISPRLKVPLDLAAGRSDTVVSIRHSLRAMQALAPHAVRDDEIALLLGSGPGLTRPAPSDTAADPLLGRRIFLRRQAGSSRITIFDGGHEWMARAAVAWLALHQKP